MPFDLSSVDDLFQMFWTVRNQREHHESEAKRMKVAEQKILNLLSDLFPANNSKSYRHNSGTFMYNTRSYVNIKKDDFPAFVDWTIKYNHTDMLKTGAAKVPVEEFINTYQIMPPGIDYGTVITPTIRKPTTQVD